MAEWIYNLSVIGFSVSFALLMVAGAAGILGALAELYCFGSYSVWIGPFFFGLVMRPTGVQAPRFTLGSRHTSRGGRLYHAAFGSVGIAVGRASA